MSDEEYYYDDDEDDVDVGGGDESDEDGEELETVVEREIEYKVLSNDDLIKKQQSEIQQVCGVLEVGAPFARMLLTHWKWNLEVLLATFLDKGRSYVYKESGVTEGDQQVLTSSFTCPSCYEDYKGDETTALSCGHRFCNTCWQMLTNNIQQYITMKIKDGESNRVKCMGSKCNNLFDESLIASFVDASTLSKFHHFLVESYVVDSNRRKWCPSVPHCGNAVEVQFGTSIDVKCKCGNLFCFKCLNIPHPPCTCEMMTKWAQKCKDDSETSNWLNSNTKTCPKCGKVIEKDGGCNLVTCKCGQYFCWLCGQSTGAAHTWTSIDGHTCGKFKDGEVDAARRSLQRYLHFFTRFKAHQDSLDKEMKVGTPQALEATMEALRRCKTCSYGQSEISWIVKASHQLFAARRVLGNSYAFAFYVFGEEFVPDEPETDAKLTAPGILDKIGIGRGKHPVATPVVSTPQAKKSSAKKNLFEDHQQQLEFTTERLSSFLATPVEKMTPDTLQNIANYAGLAEKRCKGLQDVIQNEFSGEAPATKPPQPPTPSPAPPPPTTTTTAHKPNKQNLRQPAHPPPPRQADPPPPPPPALQQADLPPPPPPRRFARKPEPPKPQNPPKPSKAASEDEEEEEEGDEDGTQKKRKKWSVGPEYDEEAALQEAIKKSTSHVGEDDKDLEEALRRSLIESEGGKPTTGSTHKPLPVVHYDEDEDFRKVLALSMQEK